MKILIVTTEFPPYVGGAGSYSMTLAKGLAKLNHEVSIFTKNYTTYKNDQQVVDVNLKNLGILIYRHPWLKKISLLFWRFIIKKHLLVFKYDLCLITNEGAQIILCSPSFKQLMPKYGVIIHGTEISHHFEKTIQLNHFFYSRKNMEALLLNAQRVITVSKSTKEWIQRRLNLGNKAVEVLNCIDSEIFCYKHGFNETALRHEYGIKERDILLMSASRLVEDKGQHLVIQALKEIEKKFDNVKLIICGDGPNKSKLIELTKKLQLESKVIFTNRVNILKIRDFYQIADVFVLLSLRGKKESFGLVFLEANACKTPVIGSRAGGMIEAIEDEYSGYLVDPNNMEQIVKTLTLMIIDRSLRLSLAENGYKRVQEKFTETQLAKNVIRKLLSQQH